jgi:hypothetical protein
MPAVPRSVRFCFLLATALMLLSTIVLLPSMHGYVDKLRHLHAPWEVPGAPPASVLHQARNQSLAAPPPLSLSQSASAPPPSPGNPPPHARC